MTENANAGDILALTTEIVAAHVSNNTVPVADLPHLINQVYQSLSNIGTGTVPVAERPQPAISGQPWRTSSGKTLRPCELLSLRRVPLDDVPGPVGER